MNQIKLTLANIFFKFDLNQKMNLHENDACPFCWHNCKPPKDNAGIASGSLVEMIEFQGGILDKVNTCKKCKLNYNIASLCNLCKPGQPCCEHYACLWNGTNAANMSLEMHNVYMRNSPYCRYWQFRPANIGTWYAKQVKNYQDILVMLTRMTKNEIVLEKINNLKQVVERAYDSKLLLLNGLYSICKEYFSGTDKCSRAVNAYYHAILKII